MFPTANSVVYYNEDGEPLGWDTYRVEPEYDPDRYLSSWDDEPEYLDPEVCPHANVSGIERRWDGLDVGECDDCGEDVESPAGEYDWDYSPNR